MTSGQGYDEHQTGAIPKSLTKEVALELGLYGCPIAYLMRVKVMMWILSRRNSVFIWSICEILLSFVATLIWPRGPNQHIMYKASCMGDTQN